MTTGSIHSTKPAWVAPSLLVLALLAVQVLLFWPFLHLAMPIDEEWAFTAAALYEGPLSWLQHGFSSFFLAYPEWDSPGTDLLRPLGAGLYKAVYALGGDHRALLLLLYAAHALCIGLLWRYARQHLALGKGLTALALLVAALSPALLSIPNGYHVAPGLQYPIYGLEIWCALLMLLAFICLLQGQVLAYGFTAMLALLMKESALPLPLAALMCTGLWWKNGQAQRNARTAFLLLLPLLLWLWLRVAVFKPAGFHATMVASGSVKALLAQVVKSALVWPSTLFRAFPNDLLAQLHQQGKLAALPGLLGIGVNLLFWLLLASALLRMAWQTQAWRWQGWLQLTRNPAVALLVLALSNLGFTVLVGGLELRYGYLFTLAAPLALFALTPPSRKGALWALTGVYALVALMGVADIRSNLSAPALHSHRNIREAGQQLLRLVRAVPAGTSRIYLVNDWTLGFSNTHSFEQVSQAAAPITRLNDITDTEYTACTPAQAQQGYTHLVRKGAQIQLDMLPPPCYDLWFHSSTLPLIIPADAQNHAQRGELHYVLPELTWHSGGLMQQQRSQTWGRHLQVSLPYDDKAVWIVFDFVTQTYTLSPAAQLPHSE